MPRPGVVGIVKVIVRERKYLHYDIRDELWDSPEPGEPPLLMQKLAYSKNGDWIGSSKFAYRLVHRRGITQFEKTNPDHCVCSVGFAPKSNKWFGWSHRSLYGFTIGSTCKKGDCHYKPSSFTEVGRTCDARKGDMCRARAYIRMGPEDPSKPEGPLVGVGPTRGVVRCTRENCAIGVGRGEWVAETMEDAKQMAVDFAKGVS